MRLRQKAVVPIVCGLLMVAAGAIWYLKPPVLEASPVSRAAPPQLPVVAPQAAKPVPESQAAFDMVRAAGGSVLLSKSGQVKAIVLTGAPISDSDLRHLAGTPDLILLNLDGTAVTDEGLAHIHDLPQLEILRLCRTSITDAGLGRLAGLPSLESLHLDETSITDEGLRQIGDFPALNSINALGCPISNRAESIVRERMPGCRVKH
jgi:hypothetical protein